MYFSFDLRVKLKYKHMKHPCLNLSTQGNDYSVLMLNVQMIRNVDVPSDK